MSAGSVGFERHSWKHDGRIVLMLAVLYALADVAMNQFALKDGWTILWPLNGVTIALLLMRPRARWPVILCGVVLGTGMGEWVDGNAMGMAICQRFISLTEVLISASLLPAFTTLPEWLRTPRIYPRFIAALVLGPGISGVMAALLLHYAQGQPYLVAFNAWATADALGIAATMPLVLALRSPEMRALFTRAALPRTILTLTAGLACAALCLSVSQYPLLFLLYPMLLLVDSRLAFPGSALTMFAVCLVAVFTATEKLGPFGMWPAGSPLSRDVALQVYLGFHVVALFPASLLFTERKRTAEELRDCNVQLTMLVALDGLTGIANRRALDERFVQEWSRALRTQMTVSLLMIDIDLFKQFNDIYGHHAGDQALARVAATLASHLRRPEDLAARFGGEEFAILLPHTELHGAALLAEQLRAATQELAIPHAGSPLGMVTVSIGYAAFAPSLLELEAGGSHLLLLERADEALYLAKQAGRNRVEGEALERIFTADDTAQAQSVVPIAVTLEAAS